MGRGGGGKRGAPTSELLDFSETGKIKRKNLKADSVELDRLVRRRTPAMCCASRSANVSANCDFFFFHVFIRDTEKICSLKKKKKRNV